jgi:hypothetical protein
LSLHLAFAIALSALEAHSAEAPRLPDLAKIVVLVQQQEIYQYDFHPLQQRQAAGNCLSQCSYVNQALTTCADDSCFCPAVTVGASTCSQCYATVNVTAASVWSSVMGICSSEFPGGVTATISSATPVTTTSTLSFPAACTSQCALISQALVSCTDDFCFCPTATSAGSACSRCLATVNIDQASDIGSAMSICSSEFGGSGDLTAQALTLGFPTTSFIDLTEYNTPTNTASNNALLGASTSPSTAPTASSSSSSSSGGLSKGAIGGIVGGFIALLVIGATVLFCCIRRPKRRDPRYSTDPVGPNPVAAAQDYPPPDYPPPTKESEAGIESPSTGGVNDIPSGRLRYLDEDEGLRVPEAQGPTGGRLSSG